MRLETEYFACPNCEKLTSAEIEDDIYCCRCGTNFDFDDFMIIAREK